jgi:hypothetical protein
MQEILPEMKAKKRDFSFFQTLPAGMRFWKNEKSLFFFT